MTSPPKITIKNLTFAYGNMVVLNNISIEIQDMAITAIIGPSGRGKSTLLTILNRLWENIPNATMQGQIRIRLGDKDCDIYAPDVNLPDLRRKVGMVFQTPNPLPMSIIKNVSFPLKLKECRDKEEIMLKTEKALHQAYLWDEVKDRLNDDARSLSGGQQQRLCIARALILEPEVLLLDEPTSSLDAEASAMIEDLLVDLKKRCTILMVSHYQDQVQRVADRTVEITDGKLKWLD